MQENNHLVSLFDACFLQYWYIEIHGTFIFVSMDFKKEFKDHHKCIADVELILPKSTLLHGDILAFKGKSTNNTI